MAILRGNLEDSINEIKDKNNDLQKNIYIINDTNNERDKKIEKI